MKRCYGEGPSLSRAFGFRVDPKLKAKGLGFQVQDLGLDPKHPSIAGLR